ncbi:hypothetical protein DENIT_12910 [Pseudomonas veronii]|nr:hypothetical protein DENIT_12910 [Pseudomonas veronii]
MAQAGRWSRAEYVSPAPLNCGRGFVGFSLTLKSIKPPVCAARQMVIPGAVYLRYYGILRGLRPVQPAKFRTPSHAGFPAWLVVF